MIIDLELLAGWVGVCGAIGMPIVILTRKINTLIKRLSVVESWTAKQQHDIEVSKDERQILLAGTLACLKGLQEQGCNGAVTSTIRKIEDFLAEQAHQGKSERR